MKAAARVAVLATPMRAPLADAAGRALRTIFRALLLVRHPRPVHARGTVLEGHISWLGTDVVSGIEWIDAPPAPRVEVIARLSRAAGLPTVLPDVIGLALRGAQDGVPFDIELASTGVGFPARFVLLPHRSPSRVTLSTLLPYRASTGAAVLICVRPIGTRSLPAGGAALTAALAEDPWRLRLHFAAPIGRWHPFADVILRLSSDQTDDELRFDSVRHPIPGASAFDWVRSIRQPSYEMVQRQT